MAINIQNFVWDNHHERQSSSLDVVPLKGGSQIKFLKTKSWNWETILCPSCLEYKITPIHHFQPSRSGRGRNFLMGYLKFSEFLIKNGIVTITLECQVTAV